MGQVADRVDDVAARVHRPAPAPAAWVPGRDGRGDDSPAAHFCDAVRAAETAARAYRLSV
jgi:hypothetical protein